LNKTQLDSLKVHWVELRSNNGYMRFEKVLQNLNIPYKKPNDNIEQKLMEILDLLF